MLILSISINKFACLVPSLEKFGQAFFSAHFKADYLDTHNNNKSKEAMSRA